MLGLKKYEVRPVSRSPAISPRKSKIHRIWKNISTDGIEDSSGLSSQTAANNITREISQKYKEIYGLYAFQ